jgi:hypothetical protein
MMPEQHNDSTHKRFYRYLLDKVREDRYPSTVMLDILERGLRGREREKFVDILLEKATADRFPSIPMLERIARIAG